MKLSYRNQGDCSLEGVFMPPPLKDVDGRQSQAEERSDEPKGSLDGLTGHFPKMGESKKTTQKLNQFI